MNESITTVFEGKRHICTCTTTGTSTHYRFTKRNGTHVDSYTITDPTSDMRHQAAVYLNHFDTYRPR